MGIGATPDYRAIARAAAVKAGFDPDIFERQINAESGFNPRARSPVGATGIAQIMPGTAKGWGVNPNDPVASLHAAASAMSKYLRSYGGDYKKALAAYNAGPGAVQKYGGVPPFAETQNYIKKILSGYQPGRMGNNSDAPFNPQPAMQAEQPNAPEFDRLAILSAAQNRAPGVSFTRAAGQAALIQKRQQPRIGDIAQQPAEVDDGHGHSSRYGDKVTLLGDSPYGGAKGKVVGRPKDRAGVSTVPSVISFVQKMASLYGQPITLGTGTAHNQFSTSGRQSAHWTGRAIDLPASGAQLIRMGRAALIAAGAPRDWAMKQTGGLFNIGGHQVIFATNIGGNHFNHVHVGGRG